MSSLIQRNFSAGEIAPALYAHAELTKYQAGLRVLRNAFVARYGGALNRSGTKFIGEVKDSSRTVRLIPFVFNSSQTYVLEFGHLYMRVIRNGAYVTETAQNITAITNANPCVLTYSGADNYAVGDEIYISGIVGAIGNYLNGRNFKVAAVNTGTNALTLDYLDGTDVNSTSFGSYTSGGTIAEVYTITTPYYEQDLSEIQFVQSDDVITLTHNEYAPHELSRTGHAAWALSEITFAPGLSPPTNVQASGADGSADQWVVTSVSSDFEESVISSGASADTLATSAAPRTLTWTAATSAQEYNVYKYSNGVWGFIGVAGTTSFVDNGIAADTTITPPRANNPFALETAVSISGITQANPAVVTTSSSHGYSSGDLVYISGVVGMTQVNAAYFKITVLTSTTFSLQDRIEANVNSSAYTAYSSGGAVARAHNYPAAVTYTQQRLCFSNTKNDPQKTWCSKTGLFKNYTVSNPIQDDDSVSFKVPGRQVNEVRHLLELGKMLVLTAGAEWSIEGDEAGIIRPADVNPKQQSSNGSSTLSPLIIDGSVIYVQARGSTVRDLGFRFESDGYSGDELTMFSSHLVENYTITDWSFQLIPHSIAWMVRSDGTLLGLTYVKSQQILGWHRHDFEDATVENVCVIPEGIEDALYIVIKRTVNGATKRYVERMHTRVIDDIKDAVFMDSSLTYDGRHTGATTMTLSGGTDWLYTETLTLTASASTFSSTDVGNVIQLTGSGGDIIRFEITGYTGATIVTGRPNATVPASMRSVAITEWAEAVDELTGLWHLEGKEVTIFGDGFVVANPNDPRIPTATTVTNGAITLSQAYGVIHVGLPYISDIETLNVDSALSQTVSDKKMITNKVTVHVEKTRGVFAGTKPPTDDDEDPIQGLYEAKVRNEEAYNDPVDLVTGTFEIIPEATFNNHGRVFIRQIDPLPMAITAIVPAGQYPFSKAVEK